MKIEVKKICAHSASASVAFVAFLQCFVSSKVIGEDDFLKNSSASFQAIMKRRSYDKVN
jgi:hypothetical protein